MMMTKTMFRSALAVFLCCSLLAVTSCDQLEDVFPIGRDHGDKSHTYYGPATTVGEGAAWAWVRTDNDGKPVALGMKVSGKALENLTEHPSESYQLTLPEQAKSMQYKTLTLDWNLMGHEPEGVYTLPHFDFHFYMMPKDEIANIAGGPDEGATVLAGKGVMPSNYSYGPAPMAVPQMGVHWVDVTSPEYTPAGFSKTFIYGSHGDKVTFLEPMITRAYLLSLRPNESVRTPIPSLLKYETAGYYPSSYTVTYDKHDEAYLIGLTGMRWHSAD